MIPLVYLLLLAAKLFTRPKILKRPPKTNKLEEVRTYYQKPPAPWVLFRDEVWIGLALLFVFAVSSIVSAGSWARLWIPITGIVLTLLVGWVWWRISTTFFIFLRDYDKYKKPV